MTISKDGWLDWAERVPGPANKLYADINTGAGIACHSMEGWYAGSLSELMKPERGASWMFSNCINGKLVQHYPVTASTWASGNFKANTTLWSVESEGLAGTPLNAAQTKNMVRLGAEFEAYTGLDVSREEPRTIWEHREVWDWSTPNAGPTACPSNRYEPYFTIIAQEEEGEVTKEEFEAFKKNTDERLAQLEVQAWGESRVPRGNPPATGYAPMNMYELASGRTAVGIPDHTHEVTVTLK